MISGIDILAFYLFVWDRYRIAKDFILQSPPHFSELSFWIESYERMIRWHILMSYSLHNHAEYQKLHAQQNLESLNNLLKTLTSQLYSYSSNSKYAEYAAHHDSGSCASYSHSKNNDISDTSNASDEYSGTIESHNSHNSGDRNTYTNNNSSSNDCSNNKICNIFKNIPEFISYMILLNFTANDGCRLSEVLKTSLFPATNRYSNSSRRTNYDNNSGGINERSDEIDVNDANLNIDKNTDIPLPSYPSTLLLTSDIIQLVLKLCTSIQRKDIYFSN